MGNDAPVVVWTDNNSFWQKHGVEVPVFCFVFLFFMYPKKGLGRVRRFIGLVW